MPERFTAALEERLAGALPGVDVQVEMAPVYRRDPGMARIEGKSCKEAAVLALLHRVRGVVHVLFIERPVHLNHHAGQVAFPGGRRETDEALVETALRETEEELGVPRDTVRILGALSPLFIPPSGYCVHPFVGWSETLPELYPEPGEVASYFSVPLPAFADPGVRRDVERHVRDQVFTVPSFDVEGRQIWGATAMMLAELAAVTAGLPDLTT